MDPIRNPYAPGAGQRPPELAGRDAQLRAFDVVLERVAKGRPERSVVLTGLRGVGKTVLLNALRSAAVRRGWGTGKLEARPDQGLRRPLSSALHQAVRELGHPDEDSVTHVLGVIRSFAQREAGPDAKLRDQWHPGIDAPAVRGRADSGDVEIDLVELFTDLGGLAADRGLGVAVFIDEMQDLGPDDVSALCAACHEISQSGLPLIVVGAGLPHLPAVLSAAKSYSERLFGYQRIDRLDREAADLALRVPAEAEDAAYDDGARRAVRRDRRLPLLHPGLRQDRVGPRPALADHRGRRDRRRPPRPSASSRSASSARATSGRRRGSGSTCARWPTPRPPCRTAARCSTRSSRCRPPTWQRCWARSRSRCRRPATRC